MSYVDIAIIALVACFALFGFIKGFFKSIVSFFSFLIAATAAVLLASFVAQLLLSMGSVGDFVVGADGFLFSKIRALLPDDLEKITVEQMAAASASGGENAVKHLFEGQSFISNIFIKLCYPVVEGGANSSIYLQSSVANARDLFALELSFGIFAFFVGIGIFLVLRIFAFLFGLLLKAKLVGDSTKKSVIGRFGGFIIGAAKGAIYALVILTILSLMANFSFMGKVNEQLDDSNLSKTLVAFSTKVSKTIIDFRSKDEKYALILEMAGYETDVRDLGNLVPAAE